MKVSGFTIVRDAVKFDYPVREAIESILPVCDEFIVNVGASDDGTLELVAAIKDPRIKIFKRTWDMGQGKTVLSQETNWAFAQCRGDWAFYIQADEIVHERDLNTLKRCMQHYLGDETVDALRFEWLHFFGSYYRFRDDDGWFQKQDRIIRNKKTIHSIEDAYAFRHTDGTPLRSQKTGCFIYHYGWVHDGKMMRKKFEHLKELGVVKDPQASAESFLYGSLDRFPIYFGGHPGVVANRIKNHSITQQDEGLIHKKYWWHPLRWIPLRYKRHRGLKRQVITTTGAL